MKKKTDQKHQKHRMAEKESECELFSIEVFKNKQKRRQNRSANEKNVGNTHT